MQNDYIFIEKNRHICNNKLRERQDIGNRASIRIYVYAICNLSRNIRLIPLHFSLCGRIFSAINTTVLYKRTKLHDLCVIFSESYLNNYHYWTLLYLTIIFLYISDASGLAGYSEFNVPVSSTL